MLLFFKNQVLKLEADNVVSGALCRATVGTHQSLNKGENVGKFLFYIYRFQVNPQSFHSSFVFVAYCQNILYNGYN